MTLDLPWPPSTNHAYRNTPRGRAKTNAANAYATDVKVELLQHRDARAFRARLQPGTRFRVQLEAHEPNRLRRDLMNLEKLAIDAIFDWLGHDDSQIDDFRLTRCEPEKPGRIRITLEALP